MTLIITVIKKSVETVNAVVLSLLVLMHILVLPYLGESSSDVISSVIAVMASQRLRSQNPNGKDIIVVSPVVYLISDILFWLFGCPRLFALSL